MSKKYRSGMFGGKFMPLHLGHLYCIDQGAQLCKRLYVILFHGSEQEKYILTQENNKINHRLLSPETRIARMKTVCSYYPNVTFITIDDTNLLNPDGTSNWDLETEIILRLCEKFDVVFSGSQDHYKANFARLYPWADFRIIDPGRTHYPISGTMLRMMEETDMRKWLA